MGSSISAHSRSSLSFSLLSLGLPAGRGGESVAYVSGASLRPLFSFHLL